MEGSTQDDKPGSFPVRRPNEKELSHLHRELTIWARFSRYNMTDMEKKPVFYAQNTVFTLGAGAGLSSYYLLRFRTKLRFPYDVAFGFLAFNAVQFFVDQQLRKSMYERILSMPSPLGAQARILLTTIREGGELPSKTFADQLHLPGEKPASTPPARSIPKSPSSDGGNIDADLDAPADSLWSTAPQSSVDVPQAPQLDGVPVQWPNAESASSAGLGSSPGSLPSRPAGERAALPRTTWDEIRARNAESGKAAS